MKLSINRVKGVAYRSADCPPRRQSAQCLPLRGRLIAQHRLSTTQCLPEHTAGISTQKDSIHDSKRFDDGSNEEYGNGPSFKRVKFRDNPRTGYILRSINHKNTDFSIPIVRDAFGSSIQRIQRVVASHDEFSNGHIDSIDQSDALSWAIRMGPEVDSTQSNYLERIRIRRLLTREERLGLPQLASSLDEVLNFAKAIEKKPWTFEEQGIEADDFQKLLQEKEHDIEDQEDDAPILDTIFVTTTGRKLSNTSVLAGYIDLQIRQPVLDPDTYDKLLLELFNDETLHWLERNGGYTIEEVVAWAWMLSAESNLSAVQRFLVWTNRPASYKRVPRFILYSLLKRHMTEPAIIQMLVNHLEHRFANTIDPVWEALYLRCTADGNLQIGARSDSANTLSQANYRSVQTWKKAVYLLMLLRSAVGSLPLLLPRIATMLCDEVKVPKTTGMVREDGLTFRTSVGFTLVLNRAVSILGRKSAEPFINVPYQERAQFIIIRHMNTFRPPLNIGLSAYRAIVSVQLRHRKTIKERLWAELKSRSWPPYREDKLGIDARKKDTVYGISRAQRALINTKEAGYSATDWEDSASILSGWEASRSPTIQTRRLFLDRARIKTQSQSEFRHESLWQSRIIATRTIEEAWAVFLNYMEEDLTRSTDVFLAMFEKIIYERDRVRLSNAKPSHATSSALAGDMPELWPSSHNPREQTYIPSPPPTFDAFYQRYRTYFPVLSVDTLCFLLPHAESLAQGYEFVQHSCLSLPQKHILTRSTSSGEERTPLESRIIAAFVRMLSSFGSDPLPSRTDVSALSHAIHLVVTRKPRARGPWRALLEALNREIGKRKSRAFWSQHWHICLGIIQSMEKAKVYGDSEMFYLICSLFVRLVNYSSKTDPEARHYQSVPSIESETQIRARTATLVKGIFKRMVTLDLRYVFSPSEDEVTFLPLTASEEAGQDENVQFRIANLLPHLLYTPSPQALHLLVRLLGVTGDRKATFDLLRWMSVYHREIEAKYVEIASGERQFRNVLVAARIVIQSSGIPFTSRMTLQALASTDVEYAAEARKVIEGVAIWGGWPNDEEVMAYMNDRIVLPEGEVESRYPGYEHKIQK